MEPELEAPESRRRPPGLIQVLCVASLSLALGHGGHAGMAPGQKCQEPAGPRWTDRDMSARDDLLRIRLEEAGRCSVPSSRCFDSSVHLIRNSRFLRPISPTRAPLLWNWKHTFVPRSCLSVFLLPFSGLVVARLQRPQHTAVLTDPTDLPLRRHLRLLPLLSSVTSPPDKPTRAHNNPPPRLITNVTPDTLLNYGFVLKPSRSNALHCPPSTPPRRTRQQPPSPF
jgi:hypothetical protein